MQLKRPAEAVGHPLFNIEGKRVELSPMGDLVLGHAHRILNAHKAVNSKNVLIETLAGHVRESFSSGAVIPGAGLVIP